MQVNISLLVGPSFESDIVSEGSHLGLGHKAGPGSHPQAPSRCGNEGHLVWTLSETMKTQDYLSCECGSDVGSFNHMYFGHGFTSQGKCRGDMFVSLFCNFPTGPNLLSYCKILPTAHIYP